MLRKVYSAALQGVNAIEVEIEVDAKKGERRILLVGLPDVAVRESRDRVTSALMNSGCSPPIGKTTINLAPASLKKEGPSFDLPIAVGMGAIVENISSKVFEDYYIVGELALNGEVRPIKGALSITLEAKKRGKKCIILPIDNIDEASFVEGIDVYGVSTLKETIQFFMGLNQVLPTRKNFEDIYYKSQVFSENFEEVKGQYQAKRAIEIAVSGGHNLLMVGPPGTGKSMIAKRIPSIMPKMSQEEAIESTKIHSISGKLHGTVKLICQRPFRFPHHTVTTAGLIGGGSGNLSPGEVSLAHNGVLFLDELPEFSRQTLEVLRQPLEDGRVMITRAQSSFVFPSRFMFVSAMNPCPCGFFGVPYKACTCSHQQVINYRQKISGPLLDRIDIQIEVPLIPYKDLSNAKKGESSEKIRERVERVRKIQKSRFKSDENIHCNAQMSAKHVQKYCPLDTSSHQILEKTMSHLKLSARSYERILKLARTLADLSESKNIGKEHLLEAIQYRSLDRPNLNVS